ncbi:hypothetical protein ACQKII_03580 [Lysinibacillus sp. NPDC048646]|uniref:hypothetical protein n=1 Tax=Lysinibacillus sp. NPDC048646 TaxID=3390574 RepID=UPI003CFE6A21
MTECMQLIAKPGQGAWSNAGIVDLGDELLVFGRTARIADKTNKIAGRTNNECME